MLHWCHNLILQCDQSQQMDGSLIICTEHILIHLLLLETAELCLQSRQGPPGRSADQQDLVNSERLKFMLTFDVSPIFISDLS